MEKEKRARKQMVTIRIEPYLAEYISAKYGTDGMSGGVRIPCTSDLYFCLWENMTKCRANQTPLADGNLRIFLPSRKAGVDGSPWKDPAYYNHLSQAAVKEIENHIRKMFNFELHRVLLENEEFGRSKRNLDVIYDFIHEYQLKSVSSDALLKNYYRYRNRLRPKKIRAYRKLSLS